MNRQQYLLMKLAEEAAEVAQIALKTAQFGMHEVFPNQPLTNATRCHAEITDLMAIVSMLNEEFNFGYTENLEGQQAKKDKTNHYYGYSFRLGEVTVSKIKCKGCNGSGERCMAGCSAHPDNWYACDVCKGTGEVDDNRN